MKLLQDHLIQYDIIIIFTPEMPQRHDYESRKASSTFKFMQEENIFQISLTLDQSSQLDSR